MAVASQKMTEIRFLLRMRGALTDAPKMEAPVTKMPLRDNTGGGRGQGARRQRASGRMTRVRDAGALSPAARARAAALRHAPRRADHAERERQRRAEAGKRERVNVLEHVLPAAIVQRVVCARRHGGTRVAGGVGRRMRGLPPPKSRRPRDSDTEPGSDSKES